MQQPKKKRKHVVMSAPMDEHLQRHIAIETTKQPIQKPAWGIRAALRRAFRLKGGGRP